MNQPVGIPRQCIPWRKRILWSFSICLITLLLVLSLAGSALAAALEKVPAAQLPIAAQIPVMQGSVPRFESGSCSEFSGSTALSQRLTLECGWLVVPEVHENPNGPTIRLGVVIIRSKVPNPDKTPVIFLQGGPGGSTIDTYLQLIPLDPRLQTMNRDIILFDQRGTMYSQPTLFCEETYQLQIDLLNVDLSKAEYDKRYEQSLQQCRNRLAAQGVDLSAYDSLENAADVNALRQALGYNQIHLYGVSYGTLLALQVMRLFPDGLASVTLDSVVPPEVNVIADQPLILNHGLETLFQSCAESTACNRAYPNLKEVFYQQVDRLNAKNAQITLTDYRGGKTYPALLDGDTFLDIIIQMQYSTDLIPLIPRTIYQVRSGDYSVLRTIYSNVVFDRSVSYGMFYSVWCAEENTFNPQSVDLSSLPSQLASEQRDSLDQFVQTCQFWNVEPLSSAANQPVHSNVPTLILSGKYDPVTPPQYGADVADTLLDSYRFIFPTGGHGEVTSFPCADNMFIQFMNDPAQKPNSVCIDQSGIKFATPGALVQLPKAINLLNPQGNDLMLLAVYGISLLFLLTAVLVYPIVWLVRKLRSRPPVQEGMDVSTAAEGTPARRKPLLYRLGPWLAALAGVMLLVFIIVLYFVVLQMALNNDNRVLFGLPGSARPLFLLPLLAAVGVVLMLFGALVAWARGAGSVWGRLYFSLLTLAGFACLFALAGFGALQAFFLG